MTVFAPYRKTYAGIYIGLLTGLFLSSAMGWLILYNQSVDLRHDMADLKKTLGEGKVVNAELKGELYTLLNPEDVSRVAEMQGLVKASHPQFVSAY